MNSKVIMAIAAALVASAAGLTSGPAPAGGSASEAPPSGTLFFMADNRDFNSEIYRMKPDGTGRKRLTRFTLGGGAGDGRPSVAHRGNSLFFFRSVGSDRNVQMFKIGQDGSGLRRVTNPTGYKFRYSVAASPLGTQVAHLRGPNIWTMRSDGSNPRRLTSYPSGVLALDLSFSASGKQLVFIKQTPKAQAIAVVNAGGSGERIVYTDPDPITFADLAAPRFSPDGQHILFGCEYSRICIMKADGSDLRIIVTLPKVSRSMGIYERSSPSPAWSPDGAFIAFDCGPRFERICISRADGTGRRDVGRGSLADWR